MLNLRPLLLTTGLSNCYKVVASNSSLPPAVQRLEHCSCSFPTMSRRSISMRPSPSPQLLEKENYLDYYLFRLLYWFEWTPTFTAHRVISPDQWLAFVYREWWYLRRNDEPFSPKQLQEIEDFEGKIAEHLQNLPRHEIIKGRWWFNQLADVAVRGLTLLLLFFLLTSIPETLQGSPSSSPRRC